VEATPLQLGWPVRCVDGTVGSLADVVIEPEERRITHLVVDDRESEARLVPAELLVQGRTRGRTVVLSCSSADFAALEPIRAFTYVRFDEFPSGDERTDVGVEDMVVVPSLGASEFGAYGGDLDDGYGVTYDRIPHGTAELRRSSLIVSADGQEVGKVDGLLVEGKQLTHVVLKSRHFFRTRALAIPIESVEAIETDRITVSLSKDALDGLPGVRSRRLPFT
jgi:sporulation protein YlmC with PRC-barrel domain